MVRRLASPWFTQPFFAPFSSGTPGRRAGDEGAEARTTKAHVFRAKPKITSAGDALMECLCPEPSGNPPLTPGPSPRSTGARGARTGTRRAIGLWEIKDRNKGDGSK